MRESLRAGQTVKGIVATVAFDNLEQLTHKLENVFDGIRYDKIQVQTEMMEHLFHAVDALNEMVEDISNGGNGKKDVKDIVSLLNLIEQGESLDKFEQPPTHASNNDENNPVIKVDEFQLTILGESQEQ